MKRLNLPATAMVSAAIAACAFSSAAFAQERLTVAIFGGAWGDALKTCILDPFSKANNVRIVPEPGVNLVTLAKLKQNRAAPTIDVAWIGGGVSELADDDGLLEAIDPDRIKNISGMHEEGVYKNKDGRIFSLSSGYYSFGLVYNTKEIQTPPTSWNDLWDSKYANRVTIPGSGNGNALPFFMFITNMVGGDINNTEPGIKKLAELKVSSYFESSGAANNSFASGEVIIGAHDGGAAWSMVDQGLPIGFVVPKEGVPSTDIRVHLVKNAPNRPVAERLIDYAISVEAATCMTNTLYLGSAVKGVVASEQAKDRLPWGPNGSFADLKFNDWPGINANRSKLTEQLKRGVMTR